MILCLMLGASFAFAQLTPAQFQQKQIELITKQLEKIKVSRKDYQKMLKFKAKVTSINGKKFHTLSNI